MLRYCYGMSHKTIISGFNRYRIYFYHLQGTKTFQNFQRSTLMLHPSPTFKGLKLTHAFCDRINDYFKFQKERDFNLVKTMSS